MTFFARASSVSRLSFWTNLSMLAVTVMLLASQTLVLPYPVKPLLAFSFDYQECLASAPYQVQYTQLLKSVSSSPSTAKFNLKTALLSHYNLYALGFLLEVINSAPKDSPIIFFNGSGRQFAKTMTLSPHSIEYFKDAPLPLALEAVSSISYSTRILLGASSKRSISVDPVCLGDIYNHREIGYTAKLAERLMDDSEQKAQLPVIPLSKHYVDVSKFDILYTQIHKLASEQANPYRRIHFYFFDNTHDILNRLKDFFEANTDLVPSTVSLWLVHYEGKALTTVSRIQGSGRQDTHYRHSILYTYEQYRNVKAGAKLHKLSMLSEAEHLAQFKSFRGQSKSHAKSLLTFPDPPGNKMKYT